MRILFVISELTYGGIETLALRMANWLDADGHDVRILSKGPGELDAHLEQGVALKYLSDLESRSAIISKASYERMADFCTVDVIQSFSVESNAISQQIIRYANRANGALPRYLAGVYHPKSYIFNNALIEFSAVISFLKTLQPENILFMSEEVKKNHEMHFKINYSNSPVIPLPVTMETGRKREVSRRAHKVVSIGRIDYFKTYNFYLPPIIEAISHNFPDIEYHIYGYGPAEQQLHELLDRANLKRTFFHGKLDYFDMPSVLEDAYCFVGMGTAAIEAAAASIPTIVAIAEDNDLSHGFLQDLPAGNVGEKINQTTYKVSDLLTSLLAADDIEYQEKATQSREASRAYNLDEIMRRYLELITSEKLGQYSILPTKDLFIFRGYSRLKSILRAANPHTFGILQNRVRLKKYKG